jgi:hypothetical protein
MRQFLETDPDLIIDDTGGAATGGEGEGVDIPTDDVSQED